MSTNTSPAVIHAEHLRKSYGETIAVDDLSLSVRSGQVVGLLGPNGAGKTTTINMLTTLIRIDSGTASVAGFDVATQPDRVRRVIGLAGQSAAVDELLTARENLRLFGRLYKIRRRELDRRIAGLIERYRMTEYADRPASTYSGGQRRRLDVVAALVASPPALFLDEPTTGLDPRSRAELWTAIEELRDAGAAIVLTTQYLEEADRLCDRIVLIDGGAEVAAGTPAQLKRDLERDVLDIHFDSDTEYEGARRFVEALPAVVLDAEAHSVSVPMTSGASASLALLRRLEDGGIAIADFQLRRPTLDDVFLALTTREEVAR